MFWFKWEFCTDDAPAILGRAGKMLWFLWRLSDVRRRPSKFILYVGHFIGWQRCSLQHYLIHWRDGLAQRLNTLQGAGTDTLWSSRYGSGHDLIFCCRLTIQPVWRWGWLTFNQAAESPLLGSAPGTANVLMGARSRLSKVASNVRLPTPFERILARWDSPASHTYWPPNPASGPFTSLLRAGFARTAEFQALTIWRVQQQEAENWFLSL
jgi:hypothetical protein